MHFLALLTALLSVTSPSLVAAEEEIPIGTILSQWDDYREVFTAMQFALEQQHNKSNKLFHFKLYADNIKTVDAYKLTRIICRQLERGIFALMGTVDPESFDTLHSYANAFEMPFVTPLAPESVYHGPRDHKQDFAIQIRPEYHLGLVDLITYYDWDKVIYIYSDFDGFLRLQRIYQSIPRYENGALMFQVEIVKKISAPGKAGAREAVQFLLELEKINRNKLKRVILDCPADMAKEILVTHVQNIHLGKRNFHYLMSSLVMDDHWDSKTLEFGAINVTGFRLINPRSDVSAQFNRQWKKYPAAAAAGTEDGISAMGALAYDSVYVMESAFNSLLREKPGLFRNKYGGKRGTTGLMACDMSGDERQKPWEHGATIAKSLKSVRVKGLSGDIRFDESGRRTNFTLDVVEITPSSKVDKIGTWGDQYGLKITKNPLLNTGYLPHKPGRVENKTFSVTTIIQAPYMMWRKQKTGEPPLVGNDRFEGFCKDLTDMIGAMKGLHFEIHPVRDGKYGGMDENAPSGWNGMIGELVRKESDVAIAPLTINSQRDAVTDFTKPFMSLGISIMIKKPAKQRPGVFSFMNPLSMEIWMCVVFAYIGVSVVLFLVSRFSPKEWKLEGNLGTTTVANAFSLANSLWFAMGAFMQQGTDITPRSMSGRIVGGAWWFFSLILISSYTANLAAFLTVERMVTPINSADDLAQQTEIEYGGLDGGSTVAFFQHSKISVYARMWEFMSARDYVLTNSTQAGIQRVRDSKGKYAFLIESTTNEYTNERMPCTTMKVGKNLDAKGYGVASTKGSGLLEPLNHAVLTLKENGELAKLKNKWWYDNTECREPKDNVKKNELSLSNVAGIFFILVGGLIVAMIAALVEFCLNSKKEAKRAKTTFTDAMKNKARLALSGGRDLDSIRDDIYRPYRTDY